MILMAGQKSESLHEYTPGLRPNGDICRIFRSRGSIPNGENRSKIRYYYKIDGDGSQFREANPEMKENRLLLYTKELKPRALTRLI